MSLKLSIALLFWIASASAREAFWLFNHSCETVEAEVQFLSQKGETIVVFASIAPHTMHHFGAQEAYLMPATSTQPVHIIYAKAVAATVSTAEGQVAALLLDAEGEGKRYMVDRSEDGQWKMGPFYEERGDWGELKYVFMQKSVD